MEAPAGVCPFPHGMTAVAASSVHASDTDMDTDMDIDMVTVDVATLADEVSWEEEEPTTSPLVQLLDGLDDTSDGTVDYVALADEVERWLAEEERQRNL